MVHRSEALPNAGVKELEILVLEDDSTHAKLLGHQLRRSEIATRSTHRVETLHEALDALRERHFDLAFVDLHVSDAHGPEIVRRLLRIAPDLAIIVLTGFADESTTIQALRHGAQEYLVKDNVRPTTLQKAVQNAIERQLILSQVRSSKEEELAIKDRFLSHVSHELRTPLNALFQFLSILRDGIGGELTEQQLEFADIAMRNAEQLERMIGDLVDVTRIQNEKLQIHPEVCDPREIIAHCLEAHRSSAASKEVELSVVSSAPSKASVLADPTRTKQVLSNLLDNAVKFTPPRGKVTILLEERDSDVEIAVEDTGPGLDTDSAKQVFDRLWQDDSATQASRKGLGLGLYICKQIVRNQGGEIHAAPRTDDGGGSRFVFTLPRYSMRELVDLAIARCKPTQALGTLRILLRAKIACHASVERTLRQVREFLEQSVCDENDILVPTIGLGEGAFAIALLRPLQRGSSTGLTERSHALLASISGQWRDILDAEVTCTEWSAEEDWSSDDVQDSLQSHDEPVHASSTHRKH